MLPESNTENFILEVINFDKHQVRKDVQTMTWLKLNCLMPMDEKIILCNVSTRWVFVSVICLCARRSSSDIEVSIKGLASWTQVTPMYVRAALLRLQELQLLKLSKRNVKVPKIREEKRREDNTCSFALLDIYDAYPRKQGKANGMKNLQKLVKDEITFQKILKAARALNKHAYENDVEEKYLPLFSTWVNGERWNDELPKVYVKKVIKSTEDIPWIGD